MNIIYIHAHDVGDFIEPYDSSMDTPALSQFAQESVLFENAFSISPTCSPSRAALLTGQFPHQCGMMGLAHRGFELKEKDHHLANVLKTHGYHRILSGIQHEFGFHDDSILPYDEVLGKIRKKDNEPIDDYQRRRDAEAADEAASWLHSRNVDSDKPFFMSVGFFQPHRPFPNPDSDLIESQGNIPETLPQTEETKTDFVSFKTGARCMDNAFDIVIKALKESGHWENSIIFFTVDHGIPFPAHKSSLNKLGLKIALLFRHPNLSSSYGKRFSQTVTHLDIFPTLCEVLGLPSPDWLEGKSFLPLISDENSNSINEVTIAESNYHAAYEPSRSIYKKPYRLIKSFSNYHKWILPNIDNSPSKDAWLDAKDQNLAKDPVILFNEDEDPLGKSNLAKDPTYQNILKKMEAELSDWMIKKNDPLCHGDILLPENAETAPIDAYSPSDKHPTKLS